MILLAVLLARWSDQGERESQIMRNRLEVGEGHDRIALVRGRGSFGKGFHREKCTAGSVPCWGWGKAHK
jgi:hypothetical protein